MPLTTTGEKVMSSMAKTYGPEKGERVFYASRNAGKPGSDKWEGKPRASRRSSSFPRTSSRTRSR